MGAGDPDDPDPLAETGEASPALVATAAATAVSAAGAVGNVRGPMLGTDTRVGRYVITGPLGAGGMGSVYAAKDPELGRRVAIKLLHAHLADMQARLLREGQAIARLRHPNVVVIHDIGTHDGNLFIAMEYVDGSTLRTWLQARHEWREILATFAAAGNGLVAAHAAGLVHRDFKPDNVLISSTGQVVVTDFGLARASDENQEDTRKSSSVLRVDVTQTGSYIGTPAYMSPEQFRGDAADSRSDQFSFCVALYEALYGKRPFSGKTFEEMQRSVLEAEPASPGPSDVPAYLFPVLERGLARDRDQRHPSMAALLEALQPPRRQRSRVWLAAPVIGAVAVVGVVFTVTRREDRPNAAPVVDPCTAAVAKLDDVWSDRTRTMVRVRQGMAAEDLTAFEGFALDWRGARLDACKRKDVASETCLDRALADVAATISGRKEGDTDWPSVPSLARCRTNATAEVRVGRLPTPGPERVVLSPDGTRFAQLRGTTLHVYAIDTGLEQRSYAVPDAKYLTGWKGPDAVAIVDKYAQRLFSVELASGQISESTYVETSINVSPDMQYALVIREADVLLVSMVAQDKPRTLGRLEPSRQDVITSAWSPSGHRIALLLGPPSKAELRIFDTRQGSVASFEFRAPTVRSQMLVWLDDGRLLFTRDDPGAAGVWSLRLDAVGKLAEPPELRLRDPGPGMAFELADAGNGRLLGRHVKLTQHVVRVRNGQGEELPVSIDLRRIKGVTRSKRVAVECESDVGWYDLDTGKYTVAGERGDVIAADGDRLLVAHGESLVAFADDGSKSPVTDLPRTTTRRTLSCRSSGGMCAVLSWDGVNVEMRKLEMNKLAPPWNPQPGYPITDVALSADGRTIAFAGGMSDVVTLDAANDRVIALPLPIDETVCAFTTYAAYAPDGALFAAQSCEDGGSRLLEFRGPKRSKVTYSTADQIAGVAVLGANDVLLNQRHRDAELVIIDGL